MTILNAKIKLPKSCRNSLERTALLERIQAWNAEWIVIHGKAGYGKTELAVQYCRRFAGTCGWYTLEESDNTEEQFLSYLSRIFSYRPEGYAAPEEQEVGVSPRPLSDFDAVLRQAEEYLDAWKQPFLLTLDGLEYIENQNIFLMLRSLAAALSGRLCLCMITRSRIPDFLSRFIMDGSCFLVEEPDLAFSEEEQRRLAGIVGLEEAGQKPQLLPMEERLFGWPAGVMLGLLYMKRRRLYDSLMDWSFFLQESMIGSFLHAEMFQELTKEEQEFLLEVAELENIEAGLCDQALGSSRSQLLIRSLLEQEIFCSQPSGSGFRIVCHPVVKLYLECRGDRKRASEVGKRAAELELEQKRPDRAARQAVRSGCTGIVLQILEQHGSELLEKEQAETLGICVSYLEHAGFLTGGRVPERRMAAHPEALGAAAQYYYQAGRYERMEDCLNQADSTFGKENKFGMYRGLYRGLLRFDEDPEKSRRMVHNTLFLLEENHYPLPFLRKEERKLLEDMKAMQAGESSGKLKVTFFGDFKAEVEKEGKALSWRTRKGGELFAYMVRLNGKPAGRKQLLAALWHDELPNNAVTMLHNMLYNLRKELALYQMEELIEYKDKLYRIHMEHIDTDLWEIDRLCRLADRNDPEQLLKNQDKFKTYWGRYLEDVDSLWAMEDREYYDTRYLKACTFLAEAARKDGRYGDGVLFYKNAMTVNGYSEELEAGLLSCYGAAHNLKQVKTEYKRFTDYLKRELQAEPGAELKKLYRQLMGAS